MQYFNNLFMNIDIAPSWHNALRDEFEKPYFSQLMDFVESEYSALEIFPRREDLFRAFEKCPIDRVKVVIIGQDPYHGDGQAHGLCFSVPEGVAFPPSLRNIFKEINEDLGVEIPESGCLDRWAEQGVLLINSVLTVRAHAAASHAGKGWEKFTDAVVRAVAEQREGVVYMLWGGYAQKKASFVDGEKNLVLKSVHPSPLSSYRGFFGCKHFSRANEYLASRGEEPIKF